MSSTNIKSEERAWLGIVPIVPVQRLTTQRLSPLQDQRGALTRWSYTPNLDLVSQNVTNVHAVAIPPRSPTAAATINQYMNSIIKPRGELPLNLEGGNLKRLK